MTGDKGLLALAGRTRRTIETPAAYRESKNEELGRKKESRRPGTDQAVLHHNSSFFLLPLIGEAAIIARQVFGRTGHESTRATFGAAALSKVTDEEAD